MIIKKFVEKDSRTAMAKIRGEFGAEAVVLSSRSVGEQFEMIAAANYDEYDIVKEFEQAGSRVSPLDEEPIIATRQDDANDQDLDKSTEVVISADKSLDAPLPKKVAELPTTVNEERKQVLAKQVDDGPTLSTLQTELAGLRELIQKELPKISARPRRDRTAKNSRRSTLRARLARMGLSQSLSAELIEKVGIEGELKESWQAVMQTLTGRIKQNEETLIAKGGVAAFVGPAGAGKTTTIAKIAVSYLMENGRGNVGLITTGGMKGASNDRLSKFARAMEIPCVEAKTATHLKAAMEQFSDKKLVLIDTPGMAKNDLRMTMQLAEFRLANQAIDSYLVVSAETDAKALEQTLNAFTRYRPVGLVVTKVDKSKRLGGIIETLVRKKVALSYISNGTRIPGDLHIGGARDLMKRAVALSRESFESYSPKRKAKAPAASNPNSVSRKKLAVTEKLQLVAR